MPTPVNLQAPWRDPVGVLSAVADRPWTLGFISGGAGAEWSYVLADPDAVLSLAADDPRELLAQGAHETADGGWKMDDGRRRTSTLYPLTSNV